MKYSQNDEQQYIEHYFANREPRWGGKLLDIGAYDGKTFSNTFSLLEKGWTGVLVEASPQVFTALQRNTMHIKDNVTLCNSCIVLEPVTGMITFYDNAGAVATADESHREKWSTTVEFTPIKVMPIHYNAIISTFGNSFDMVDIDIEGQSADLFLAMFPLMPDVDLWVVEHDDKRDDIKRLASAFDVLYENGENLVLGRKR
jgi:FkbM family methyltransferase